MGAHGGKPLQRIKGLLVFSIPRSVEHLGFIREVSHSLLRERRSNDVAGHILHRLLVTGLNPGAAMGIETGMSPRHDELDNLLRDLPFPQKDPQHFVLKDLFQGLRVQRRGHLERYKLCALCVSITGLSCHTIPEADGAIFHLFFHSSLFAFH
jgi:hypothetical protein